MQGLSQKRLGLGAMTVIVINATMPTQPSYIQHTLITRAFPSIVSSSSADHPRVCIPCTLQPLNPQDVSVAIAKPGKILRSYPRPKLP